MITTTTNEVELINVMQTSLQKDASSGKCPFCKKVFEEETFWYGLVFGALCVCNQERLIRPSVCPFANVTEIK